MPNSNRIDALDSLRGLASLSVVIHHTLLVLPIFYLANLHGATNNKIIDLLTNSPLHIVWDGPEAVLLFFVLSGFVLALPFLNNRKLTYPNYLKRRFTRIYIPYIVSIGISALLFELINPTPIGSLSTFFNQMWAHQLSVFDYYSYILMLGNDFINLNGSTWSLVHEMRISIIFPIIMLLILNSSWIKCLVFGIGASLLLWVCFLTTRSYVHVEAIQNLFWSLGQTFYYTSFFIIGAVLAKYRTILVEKTKTLQRYYKLLLSILFIFLYNIEWMISPLGRMKSNGSNVATLIIEFTVAASVVLLFVLVLSSTKLQSILIKPYFLFLGKISYSLYLVHIIVILILIHTLTRYIDISILLIMSPVLSIISATIFYKFIEQPAMRLGKRLTSNQKSTKEIVRKVS